MYRAYIANLNVGFYVGQMHQKVHFKTTFINLLAFKTKSLKFQTSILDN